MAFWFSTLSAATELVVTWAVLTVIRDAYRGTTLRRGRLFFALTYELLFNITYMVLRLTTEFASGDTDYPGWFIGFVGFHGTLSLVMFIGLVALFATTVQEWAKGRNFLAARPRLTRLFVALWIVSVATGEMIYLLIYAVGVGG